MNIKIEVLKREEGYHAFASFDDGPEQNAQGATEFAAAQAAVLKLFPPPAAKIGPRIPEHSLRNYRATTPDKIRAVLKHNEGTSATVKMGYTDLGGTFTVRTVQVRKMSDTKVVIFDLDKQQPRTFRLAGINWVEGEL